MAKKFTDIAINNLKPGAVRREISDGGTGLWIVIQPSGARSYAVRYRYGGKPRKLTLKGGLSLKAARAAASAALLEVEQGRDPAEKKKAEKAKTIAARADTVQAICEEYLKREGAKLRTVSERVSAFKRLVYPEIGNQQIDALKRSQIVRLLDKIEDENGERTADLVLAYLRKVFNWHATRSDEFRSPIVRGMGRYKGKEHERSRVLSDDELRSVWRCAEQRADPFANFIKFLLLTAARRKEAAQITRAEINHKGDWLLPAARNKTKLDLIRPLSEAARVVIEAQPEIEGCPFIFTSTGKGPIAAFAKFRPKFQAASGTSDWTLHDLRRTARSLMSRAGVNSDIAERCLGHTIKGVRATYDRHEYRDEKQKAFEALAAQIQCIVYPSESENVTPLRPKRHAQAEA